MAGTHSTTRSITRFLRFTVLVTLRFLGGEVLTYFTGWALTDLVDL